MKTIKLLALLGAVTLAQAAPEPTPPPAAPPVIVSTTVSELASGFAAATRQMSDTRIVIFYKSAGKTVSLKGVRSVRALNGVLLINLSAGDSIAISAEQVLLITDGPRTP